MRAALARPANKWLRANPPDMIGRHDRGQTMVQSAPKRARTLNDGEEGDKDRLLLEHVQGYIAALLGKTAPVPKASIGRLQETVQNVELLVDLQKQLQGGMHRVQSQLAHHLQELKSDQLAQDHHQQGQRARAAALRNQLQSILAEVTDLKRKVAGLGGGSQHGDRIPADLTVRHLSTAIEGLLRRRLASGDVSVEAPDRSMAPSDIEPVRRSVRELRDQMQGFKGILEESAASSVNQLDHHLTLLKTVQFKTAQWTRKAILERDCLALGHIGRQLDRLQVLAGGPSESFALHLGQIDGIVEGCQALRESTVRVCQTLRGLREHNKDLRARLQDVGDRQRQLEGSLAASQEAGQVLRQKLDNLRLEHALREAGMKTEVARLEERIIHLQSQLALQQQQREETPFAIKPLPEEPATRLDPKTVVVAFSGIRDPQLRSGLKQLGVTVHEGAEFSDQVWVEEGGSRWDSLTAA